MTPSIELRIQTVIKAMTEVVLPAIAEGNDLAREQARLVIAQIELIGSQWESALAYDTLCLRELVQLARTLCKDASGGPQTLQAAAALAVLVDEQLPGGTLPTDKSGVDRARSVLAAAIDALVRATEVDSSPVFHAASANAILDHAALQAWRDRVWFAGAGMDPERASLPSIATMLEAAAAGASRDSVATHPPA